MAWQDHQNSSVIFCIPIGIVAPLLNLDLRYGQCSLPSRAGELTTSRPTNLFSPFGIGGTGRSGGAGTADAACSEGLLPVTTHLRNTTETPQKHHRNTTETPPPGPF